MLTSSSSSASHVTNNNGSYSNDRGGNFEVEYPVDPASGGFFNTDFKKHDDLKEMLDSNKDSLKLEAMKRIIGMVAKGKDASMLFPAVVKNVVSKNIEVKKLVYVYLERYAEEQQDLALLSISTFQRALKEPNQLIRAGALRVLSSIRVKMISPIVMLAIRDASSDMSPYVRKTAAHAIPKLYGLDNELKPELITIIQKLLADKTVLVIGSAVMAFTEVCPERIDLIHPIYRKLCALLVDVDEWGQVTIVNMLTRYARMQFADPNIHCRGDESDRPFYDSGSDTSDKAIPTLDPDHRLLLRSTRPLLQSRNAAVVMAVTQLYYHAAPKSESILTAKAMVRLLRSHVEVQSVVLNAIASITLQNRSTFEPYLKSFFVRTSDPTNIKLLKLEILTNLTNDSNVSIILRELQTYITNSDKKFVAAAIQAIGRCACSINEVTDTCLNGLVSLLSNRDEAVVAESVIVIKRLLQSQAADPKEIITHMAKLLDSITIPQARAAILWLLGEHSQKVPHIAPDVLRKLAKTFADEHEIVKLQVMNLAVKLYTTNPEQTTLLCRYIFNLARYDQNYDIRDKARLLKQFVPNQNGKITSQAARIFLANKPAPFLQSQYKDHENLQLGSLSHYIKQIATGYEPLPPFPTNPPPGDLRNVESISSEESRSYKKSDKRNKDRFVWESADDDDDDDNDEDDDNDNDDDDDDDDDSSDESSSNSSDNNSSNSSSSDESDTTESDSRYEESSNEQSDKKSGNKSSSSSSSDDEVDGSDSDTATKPQKVIKNNNTKDDKTKSNLDLLLDLGDVENTVPVMQPSISGNILTPVVDNTNTNTNTIQVVPSLFTNTKSIELLSKINGKGLSANYRFTRSPHILSPSMVNINIMFTNNSNEEITDIRLGKKNLGVDMAIYDFACIQKLMPNGCLPATLGIDFNDTIQAVNFEIVCSLGNFSCTIKPPIGELIRPCKIIKNLFIEKQTKLGGMNEHTGKLKNQQNLEQKIIELINIGICDNSDPDNLKFCGQTLKSSNLILISVIDKEKIVVNCENVVFGSVLLNELTHNLGN